MSHKFLIPLLAIFAMLFAAGAEAAPAPRKCGGILPLQCPSTQFCQLPAGKCGADMMGTCTHVPIVCPQYVKPVCGCDGKTYTNDCWRQYAKVSKRSNGKCKG